ncbi:Na+/H+ antiporter subunit E [Cyanobium sp. CH-040]|uniref:Na+/H+ antiporter subunit E n=1 Tax=Cyanobium sp. CH-040 TaxID=2823708 RepID=UPI0020CC665C|nr:Na+/H+ antiporter subunit E [Cyanobium sp. CH-040]MCP9926638.1 Na+/H+ antiporter subunit E [Cyanobium sp. CH-040]
MIPALLNVALRVGIWMLLTQDPRTLNVLIGVGVALLLPLHRDRAVPLRDLAGAVGAVLVAVPQAFHQAVLLLTRRRREGYGLVPGSGRRSDLLMFLEVFTITLTPFSICLGMDRAGRHYQVHTLTPERVP